MSSKTQKYFDCCFEDKAEAKVSLEMVNTYRRGRIVEKKVSNSIKAQGFTNVRRSAGSRGPADIYAVKGDQKYYFQVKSGSARANRKDIARLQDHAKSRHGAAVVVHRAKGKNQWRFYGNWR
jgi:Holliday junction resolvase